MNIMIVLLTTAIVWAFAYAKPSQSSRQLFHLAQIKTSQIDAPGCGQRPLLADNGVTELYMRIVGGGEAVPYSWPGICSLRLSTYPADHMCGGSLVKNLAHQYYLITAAHCVEHDKPSMFVAYCGIHERTSLGAHGVEIHFSTLVSHSLFSPYTYDYDIAVMRVSTVLPTNNYIAPVCLPNEDWYEGELSIIAGWGTTSSGGSYSYRLHQVIKPIKARQVCETRYGPHQLTPRMFCAGLPQGGIDSCQGDSGGPLNTYRHGRWTLTGVISWGYGCAEAFRPGVYTDVIEVKDWIDQQIN